MSSILDDYGIYNYKGFIPLNYVIPKNKFMDLNRDSPLAENIYERYCRDIYFETDSVILFILGVQGTNSLEHIHIIC